MKGNGQTINETAKESCIGSLAMKNMKEIGKTISKVVLALIFGLMGLLIISYSEIDMLVTGHLDRDMEKVLSIILMEVNTKETGEKTSNMVQVSLLLKMVLNMMGHLKMTG